METVSVQFGQFGGVGGVQQIKMAECRTCGNANVFNLKLQDDPTAANILLYKLFQIAKVKLSLEQSEVICARCAYNIEDNYTWLCNVQRYQRQRQASLVPTHLFRETFEQEENTRNFNPYVHPVLPPNDVIYTDRQNKAYGENVNYRNFVAAKKGNTIKNVTSNGWNISQTVTHKTTSIMEQKYPYNVSGRQQKQISYFSEMPKPKARPGVKLRRYKPSDMLASNDSPTSPNDANVMEWESSPDEDLIQRVRAKIQKQDF